MIMMLVLIVLAPPLHGALIIRIKPYFPPRFTSQPLSLLGIWAGAGGARVGVGEEEVEEFVGDGEVGLLLELLEGGKTEEDFKEGEGGVDWREERGRRVGGGDGGVGGLGECEVWRGGCVGGRRRGTGDIEVSEGGGEGGVEGGGARGLGGDGFGVGDGVAVRVRG